jgi:hypothetical protein
MHRPKAYDPAQHSDAAEYQPHCLQVLHINFSGKLYTCFEVHELGTPTPSLAISPNIMSKHCPGSWFSPRVSKVVRRRCEERM